MSRINPAQSSGVWASPACDRPDGYACWDGSTLLRSWMTHMQDNTPTAWSTRKSILVAAIVALAMLWGGYQIGKDMALRDSARQAAGK